MNNFQKILQTAIIILLIIIPSITFADITFTDNKWENEYDCATQNQVETWPPECNDMTYQTFQGFKFISLTDGSTNKWTQSTFNTDEYYLNSSDLDDPNTDPEVVGILGTIQDEDGTAGALLDGQSGWGNPDGQPSATLYVKQSIDPDGRDPNYIYTYKTRNTALLTDSITSILEAASNPLGTGKGMRFRIGDGNAIQSTPAKVTFSSPQPELWIRWYMRYEDGFKWNGQISSDKNLYIHTNPSVAQAIAEFRDTTYAVTSAGGGTSIPVQTEAGEGWNGIMGGDESDGLFHCYEIHLKMDTDTTDGIGQLWLDGILKDETITANWSWGIEAAKLGWGYINHTSNQATPDNRKAAYLDWDGMIIINSSSYTGFVKDAEGNDMIGPIGYTPTPTTSGTTRNGFGVGQWGR